MKNLILNQCLVTLITNIIYLLFHIIKTQIKSCNNKITINSHGKSPTEGLICVSLSAILIGSVFNLGKNYDPQTFLEEWKYKVKEKEKKGHSLNMLTLY